MRARRRIVVTFRQKMNFLNTAIQRVPFAVKPRGLSQTLCWGKRVSHTALYRPRAAPESSARAGRKPYARLKGVSSLDIDRTMMPFAAPAPPTIRAACPAKNPRGMSLHRPQRSTTHLRARRRGREGERERESNCSANTYRLELLLGALESWDRCRHNAHAKLMCRSL